MTPEMQEVRDYVGRTIWADATIMRKDVLDRIDEIENRTLPQRVAEILEQTNVNSRFCFIPALGKVVFIPVFTNFFIALRL